MWRQIDVSCEKPESIGLFCCPNGDFSLCQNTDVKSPFFFVDFVLRGVGFRFTETQIFITEIAATPTEILTETMRQIRCPPFRKRFNEYIESGENPITYINEKHRARFTLAARNVHKENYAVLSALYLLTAD